MLGPVFRILVDIGPIIRLAHLTTLFWSCIYPHEVCNLHDTLPVLRWDSCSYSVHSDGIPSILLSHPRKSHITVIILSHQSGAYLPVGHVKTTTPQQVVHKYASLPLVIPVNTTHILIRLFNILMSETGYL